MGHSQLGLQTMKNHFFYRLNIKLIRQYLEKTEDIFISIFYKANF